MQKGPEGLSEAQAQYEEIRPKKPLTVEAAQRLLDATFPDVGIVIRYRTRVELEDKGKLPMVLEVFLPMQRDTVLPPHLMLSDVLQVLTDAGVRLALEIHPVIEGRGRDHQLVGFAQDISFGETQ